MDVLSIHNVNNKLIGKINGQMTKLNWQAEIIANLKRLARETTSSCVLNLSTDIGKEKMLVGNDKKYYFAFIDGTFKVFDRKQNKFRKVRYFFESPEDEKAFKELATVGSFVLGLSGYMVGMYFDCNDVFKNEE
jgi:hypothetical protein